MRAFRTPSIARCLVIAGMLLSWFVITNHCALVRLHAQVDADEETPCCHPQKQAPVNKAPCDELTQCCRVLKASLSGNAEVKVAAAKVHIQFFAILQVLAAELTRPAQELVFDHGPPRAVSFAESVLQRSLLSNAPPLAA